MTDDLFAGLIEKAKSGDVDSMAELVARYEPEVRLVARVRLGKALRPYIDSVDLVQSVHRSVMVGLRNNRFDISSPEKLVALAVTVVRRKVSRHWRKLQRQQRLEGSDPSGMLADLLISIDTQQVDPTQSVVIRDGLEQILKRLDGVDRQLVELRIEGFNTAEIAQQLDMNADVLRVRLSRLRKRLRDGGVGTDFL